MKHLVFVVFVMFFACTQSVEYEDLEHRERIAYVQGEDTPFSGRAVDYFPDGSVREEAYYKDGVLHGTWKAFSPDGTPVRRLYFKEGAQHGEQIFYNESGDISSRAHFDRGELQDVQSEE
ncbi:toxin-antitoxin system YwqK family antitoxin [Chitinivibrio alkaliphilus]|uniref:MORN repeat-containing protein n=1 Tax=Chitinivibrio alkaliphilus ACht1 TaxID=1313304 RepID=U7D7Q2_9BACT|nr:hypothetical protein [Chitinivibrio alkaliphilus]ERP31963.1 hypothetical protein CALK_1184 [Chitinivibrio alkaliphilus ACht1]